MRWPLSTRDRLRIFTLHGGVCHFCGGRIQVGEAWDVSHDRPLALLGEDDDDNRKPAHRKCHRRHTAEVDQPAIAKAKRREARHLGAARKPRTIRQWRKFDGTPVFATRER
ncbi:HNH endonuclease signature motif containing protein [Bosea sp. (in: a-proteobacteria)]|uniref:HNH endonuclease signature motif containing protein n=1 Tax=Bosea sp. (in: a-proteobacteria) TaxID=1871050 RepID=UPI002618401B|nr:HNH endonuclease signature motif containing protein [Bosea sp. (in: a-proteobacteria)]MCO5092630.1 HNH endonuclease [Bosea sp. (in: a-proteobacteria)]